MENALADDARALLPTALGRFNKPRFRVRRAVSFVVGDVSPYCLRHPVCEEIGIPRRGNCSPLFKRIGFYLRQEFRKQ